MASTRRLAAILAADVAGYSRLMGAAEEGTHQRLRAHFAELVDPKIEEHHGRTVKNTGDGLLAEFPSVVDAVRCAVEIQREMIDREPDVREEQRIKFRIGINLGDVIVQDDDIFGDGVNIAARIEGLAAPGRVCVSGTVRDHIGDRLPYALEDLGDQTVKNIARPLRVYRVCENRVGDATVAAKSPLALPDKPSIAVLPFQNMSGDPEQEYFADGIVEEIITALSRLRWFFVIARNSSFTYKGRAVDAKQAGRELGVRYLLEGSVRKAGNRLRITAQLVEAESGNHLWAERYDRDLTDIFMVQDEITERVVAAIEPELYASEEVRARRKPPESLDAWECVIRALSAIGQGTREANTEAERLCRRAILIAPGYAQAHSLLAWALVRRAFYSGGELRALATEISAEAQAALAIDDRDPWAHLVQGNLFNRLRRFDDAARALRRALELNPNFALAHAQLAAPLANQGMYQEATDSARHALRLSRNDRSVRGQAAIALMIVEFAAERYAECAALARTMIENIPEHIAGHLFLTAALAMRGDQRAIAEARDTLLRLWPNFSLAWMKENLPFTGEMRERISDALRKVGMPEEP